MCPHFDQHSPDGVAHIVPTQSTPQSDLQENNVNNFSLAVAVPSLVMFQVTCLLVIFSTDVQEKNKLIVGRFWNCPVYLAGHCGNPTMTCPSGDDRSVSCSAIFGVVRHKLLELHMCGIFHNTWLTDFHLRTFYDHSIT